MAGSLSTLVGPKLSPSKRSAMDWLASSLTSMKSNYPNTFLAGWSSFEISSSLPRLLTCSNASNPMRSRLANAGCLLGAGVFFSGFWICLGLSCSLTSSFSGFLVEELDLVDLFFFYCLLIAFFKSLYLSVSCSCPMSLNCSSLWLFTTILSFPNYAPLASLMNWESGS